MYAFYIAAVTLSTVICNRRPKPVENTFPPTHGENESKSFYFTAVSTPPQHHLSSGYFAAISEETL